MKQYRKQINGQTIVKTRKQIVVYGTKIIKDKNGKEKEIQTQTINPNEELILSDGWEIVPEPTEAEILERAKNTKKHEALMYGSSSNVDVFSIGGVSLWLDKATRTGLELRFKAEMAVGKTETTLWHGVNQFPLSLEMAFQLLYALEIYASACYDNTQRHLAEIEKLSTLEEIRDYDYQSGYPEKLKF